MEFIVILDSSILLAVIFNENSSTWCLEQIHQSQSPLKMSLVNLTECLIVVEDRQPKDYHDIAKKIFASGIEFEPPNTEQAVIAARARHQFPINLGDCFAYALAKWLDQPLLALDHDFFKTDAQVICPITP